MSVMTADDFRNHRRVAESNGIVLGSRWQHYKGGVYVVDGFVIDSHHGLFHVLYHRIDGPSFDARAEDGMYFTRPPEEWPDIVDHKLGTRRFTAIDA